MDSAKIDELEKVLRQRKKFDYSTQPIEFLWGYDSTLIEAVPELITRIRELETENRALQGRVRKLERMADIMAEQLACVEIAPSICHGCKEQDMFGMYSCGGKDCIYFMVKQAAKEAGIE